MKSYFYTEPGAADVRAAGDKDVPAAAEEAGTDIRAGVAAQGLRDPRGAVDADVAAVAQNARANGGGMADKNKASKYEKIGI